LSVALVDENGGKVEDIQCSIYSSTQISNKIYKADIKTTQLIKKTAQGERQIININIFSGGIENVKIRINKDEWKKPKIKNIDRLPIGKQVIQLEVPVISTTEPADIQITSSSDKLMLDNIILPKANRWTLYFVQHVHTDIGYTRPQTEILPEHLRFIDYALDFCDLTDNYPDDARFRWTCEVTWPVREYLKRRPPEQIERLIQRIKEGRIEIAGMFLNMSELAPEAALAASLQPIREIKKHGIPVKTALQNDVNGIGWCLVDYFQDIGLKYVNMGINKTRSILPFDKPTSFWWESPSGKRVLAYRADHYHVGNHWKIHEGNPVTFEQGILEYLTSLEERKYPFNQIVVQFSGYNTDNSPPSTSACDLVKNWNDKYSWPKLRIATAHEFLEDIEKRYADQLPVYRVAWPDWWTDGFGSAARETAEARITQNNLQISQGLLSMASLLGADINPETNQRLSTIQDALLFYQEHTFGSSESISDPESENSMTQWGEKSSYVWEAVKYEGLMREEAMGLLQTYVRRGKVPTVVVFNTLNWSRSGLVNLFIDHEILPLNGKYHIVDNITGNKVPMQPEKTRSEGTYWSIWADEVPSMGFRTFSIVQDTGKKSHPKPGNTAIKNELENSWYKLTVDPTTGGLKSLYDKQLKTELCDQDTILQVGQFIYERIPDSRDFFPGNFIRTGLREVTIDNVTEGSIWTALHISARADGFDESKRMQIEYRLYKTKKMIEIIFQGYKNREEKAEACYVVFPFNLKDAQIVYEGQGGMVIPGKTQLPGSSADWHTVQNYAAIRNGKGQVIINSPQIPLVQFGDINLSKWQYKAEIKKPHIYSWVMNNYWFTNFRAYQEGGFHWQYYLTSTKDSGNEVATRSGWNTSMPMQARVLTASDAMTGNETISSLSIENTNLLLVSAQPASKSIQLHVRETSGQVAFLGSDELGNNRIKTIDEIDVLGDIIKANISSVTFEPYETKFIKINLSEN